MPLPSTELASYRVNSTCFRGWQKCGVNMGWEHALGLLIQLDRHVATAQEAAAGKELQGSSPNDLHLEVVEVVSKALPTQSAKTSTMTPFQAVLRLVRWALTR